MMFSELAEKARHQESVACFGAAAQYWIAANKVARKQANKEWAANRAMYCSRLHARRAGPR